MNPFSGRVSYVNGLELDRPLAITRYAYVDQPRDLQPMLRVPFTISFTWDTRSQVIGAAHLNAICIMDGSTERCPNIPTPNAFFAYQRASYAPTGWQGTVIEGKAVERNVFFRTPYGARFADLLVSKRDGTMLGLLELKAGNSPYKAVQELTDAWIREGTGLRTDLGREKYPSQFGSREFARRTLESPPSS